MMFIEGVDRELHEFEPEHVQSIVGFDDRTFILVREDACQYQVVTRNPVIVVLYELVRSLGSSKGAVA